MKKLALALFILCASVLFFTGCGGGSSDYDKYADPTNDADSGGNDADSDADTGKSDPTDMPDKEETPDDDGTEFSEDDADYNNDIDAENDTDPDADTSEVIDFWTTCEGIIACINLCLDDDSGCVGRCYGKGSDDGQNYYKGWKQCFEENCAENRTAECSAENCSEWDEKCNVASAFEYEIPAPYGNINFEGTFNYIINNSLPNTEEQIEFKSFASGNILSMSLTPSGTIVSFVVTTNDPRDGKVINVYQAPYNRTTGTPQNPVVILRIKVDSAVEGNHTVGVSDDSDARLIVGEVDSKYNISCYHAFGTGSFKISKAVIESGASGVLSFSDGTAELFNPQNIPELGGDAREILGVSSCSLLY